jgi:hypothetical protein
MRTIWLQGDSGINGGQFLIDADTRGRVVLAEGTAATIRFGSFTFDKPKDLGDFDSIKLSIHRSQFALDEAALVEVSVLSASVTDLITLSAWNGQAAYNVEFSISAPSMTFDLGGETEATLFMVVAGIDGSAVTVLGSSPITVYADQDAKRAGVGWKETWQTALVYDKGDFVKDNGVLYICTYRHTSAAGTRPGVGASWDDVWDLLLDGSALSPSAATILAQLLTVDGAGSGLDADLLDGNSSAHFATASSLTSHTSATSGVHGMSVFGASLVDDADAPAARATLGLGTAATSASSAFEAAGAVSSHSATTSGVHGISAFGASLVDDADASAARSTLGLGSAATSASSAFEASGAVSTHASVTSGVHGISAFGASLIDDADAATARTTMGLGGAATLSVGTTAGTVCAGDDSRLSNSRTPTAHASTHQSGGSDAIKLDDLATPDDNTDLNATTGRHGLLPKLGGGTTNFLRADGTWSAPFAPPVPVSINTLTADGAYATSNSGEMFVLDTSSNAVDLDLPNGNARDVLWVMKTNAGFAGTVSRDPGVVLYSGGSDGNLTLEAQKVYCLYFDGTSWRVLYFN